MVFFGVGSDRTSCSERFIKINPELVLEWDFSTLSVWADTLSPSLQVEYFQQPLLLHACARLSGPGGLVDGAQWNKAGDCELVSEGGTSAKVILSRPRLSMSLHASPLWTWTSDVNVSLLIKFNAAVDVCTVTQNFRCSIWYPGGDFCKTLSVCKRFYMLMTMTWYGFSFLN